jgi:hypothetical protein
MTGWGRSGLIAVALFAAATPAGATQICGWLTETVSGDSVHDFSLWLETDADADIFYAMKGEGVVTPSSRMYSPGSGTFSLHAGKAEKVWGFGATLEPPGDIDIIAEVHAPPADIFSDDETALLAAFKFDRHVPEGETTPPQDFAKRQCTTLGAAP